MGGYGLRAFIPFFRSTGDCDLLRKEDGWHFDEIKEWFSKEASIEAFEKDRAREKRLEKLFSP